MDLQIRPVDAEELLDFVRAEWATFSMQPAEDELGTPLEAEELDRTLAVFDRGRIVATARAFSEELTVPGPMTVPAAAVTSVGVLPTHRRRGLLTELMRRQLADVRDHGEPVAVLHASESNIYGRFGYGMATFGASYEIDTRHTAFTHGVGSRGEVVLVDKDEARATLPGVFDRVRRTRPGEVSRRPSWWESEVFREPEHHRRGASPLFFVVRRSAGGEIEGYASYRTRPSWDPGFFRHTLEVTDFVALTVDAHAALWRYCLDVDLVATVKAANWPLDDPLRWMLADPRRLLVTQVADVLWVRPVDVRRTLSARRYTAPGRLTFRISDPFCPDNEGTYVLEGGADGAECRRVGGDGDLALDVSDIGAAYLGGVSFSTLARAGRVTEVTPGSLFAADAMFGCTPGPWTATHF